MSENEMGAPDVLLTVVVELRGVGIYEAPGGELLIGVTPDGEPMAAAALASRDMRILAGALFQLAEGREREFDRARDAFEKSQAKESTLGMLTKYLGALGFELPKEKLADVVRLVGDPPAPPGP